MAQPSGKWPPCLPKGSHRFFQMNQAECLVEEIPAYQKESDDSPEQFHVRSESHSIDRSGKGAFVEKRTLLASKKEPSPKDQLRLG
jgi:hypothetical protein